jgi:hypothetical protein
MFIKSHSSIIHYPISDEFPLAKNVIFHEYIIKPNEYLFIPKKWFHWVFSEPETLSCHYVFYSDKGESTLNESDLFQMDIESGKPFQGVGICDTLDTINDFYEKEQHQQIYGIISSNCDVSPMRKMGNEDKFICIDTIGNFMKIDSSYYKYIGKQEMSEQSTFYKKYKDINHFIPTTSIFSCVPTIWCSLDKPVQSGLHYDCYSSLIYVITGQKRVLLAEPSSYPNLYVIESGSPKYGLELFQQK